MSGNERMMDMLSKQPFTTRLKKDFLLSKLVAIESDISEPNLNLNESDTQILIKNVSIVFHVAASVKFEAPVEVNMKHNVVATKGLLDMASKFEKLLCFIHVSTAYSNCQLSQIDERIYSMEVPDDPMSLKVTKAMIDNRPNTYTYTKAMAENVASKYASRINIVIVRPSIVMSSLKEPDEGWIDTINGPVGLSVLGALGILQKIKVNSEVVFDLIPADIVSNALVSIAWACTEKRYEFLPGSSPSLATIEGPRDVNSNVTTTASVQCDGQPPSPQARLSTCKSKVAERIEKIEMQARVAASKNIPITRRSFNSRPDLDGTVRVFNLTTGTENPCSFYHYFSTGRDEAYKSPSRRALRPLLKIPKQKGMNPIMYWIHKVFCHLLFAYIVDTILGFLGQKKMVVKAVNRMHHANEMFDYFCSNQWIFVTDNVKRLRELQSTSDKETFNCDVRKINWSEYARLGWFGCRRFILKEDDSTIPYARVRYQAICLCYYLVKVLLFIGISYSLGRMLLNSSLIATSVILPLIYGIIYLI